MIVLFTILALLLGLAYGLSGLELPLLTFLSQHTDLVLYLLMFTVGISVGMHRGLFRKIREYHIRIFIIPFGIILGSLVGGLVCAAIFHLPLGQGAAIASGMGWYSLAGATISQIGGSELGSVAFLSNLMREIFSFIIIPVVAIKLNYYTCIAPAGATSEDTTLPVMLKYTNEETVVLSVLNGIICSFFLLLLRPHPHLPVFHHPISRHASQKCQHF